MLLSIVPGVCASTVQRLDLPELVARAEVVVEGRCVASETLRGPRGLIHTRTTVLVGRGWRGAGVGQLVTWLQPGGELGDEGLLIPGLPALRVGEEALLFLTPATASDVRVPVGLGQGLRRITADPVSGAPVATPELAGLSFVDAAGQPEADADAPAPSSPAPDGALLLAELQLEIARLVAADDARRAQAAAESAHDVEPDAAGDTEPPP